MVLPALFAACTNDDFETVQNNSLVDSVLKNRAKGELILNASKAGEEDAQTRIVGTANGTAIDWLWESADDKIGGVVVDYKAPAGSDDVKYIATANDSYTITNYPFAPNINAPSASAEFSTPTTVVQGAYMFYNLYDGNNTKRGQIKAEIDRIQKVNAGEEAGLKQVGTTSNGGQNFFVSPIMDMAIADGEPIETPVTLTSAHSVLKFTFKADLEDKYWGNFTVNKVVIKGAEESETPKFARTLTIDPKKIAEIQLGIANADPDNAKYFKGNGAIKTRNTDGTMVSDDQIKTALKLVTDAISLKDEKTGELKEIGKLGDYCNDLQFQLETPYVFNSKDDVMELMVVVPAGKYKQDTFTEALNKDPNLKGLFELDVYTSEGIYKTYLNSYDEDGNMVEARTLERGKKYGMPEQTLIIGGGKTNITLFDQNDEFTVETTEDWNYTIDYINAHYRDFGNENAWKTPLVKIAKDSKITVDADHYFPAFPVKYEGDADLYLVGQNEYKFNPTCAILDNEDRPELYVVDQKNASVVFDMDVENTIKDFYGEQGKPTEDKEKDGVQQTITGAIRLISDAQVVIKKGTEVQFEELVNRGTMTIEEDVKVEVDDNQSDMTQAILLADATNEGVMNIYGRLSGEFKLTNAAAATINVKGFENSMNNKIRGIVDLKQLDNYGIINIESGVQYKGTYGGKVDVTTLNNTFTTGTKGEINNNGELIVTKINSNGTITVGKDPYALIQLTRGYVTKDGYGSVVLADATQYEIYDRYYSQSSSINTNNVSGTIETTLTSQAEYDEVVKNHVQYKAVNSKLQTALEVLNKVTVNGVVLELSNKAPITNYQDINFVLGNNAGLDIKNVNTISLGSIASTGTNTSVIATVKVADAPYTVNVNYISSLPNADLTIDGKVKVMVGQPDNSILVYGKMTNNGWIDTEASTIFGKPNKINATINKGGSFINNGQLSQKAEEVYSMDIEEYAELSKFISDNFKLTADGKWQGLDNTGIRIEKFNVQKFEDMEKNGWPVNNLAVEPELFAKLLTEGVVRSSSDGFAGYCVKADNAVYALYFGNAKNDKTDTYNRSRHYQAQNCEVFAAEVLAKVKEMPIDGKTWFFVSANYGTIDLRDGKAWGEIAEGMNKGAKYGDFENDK